VVTNFQVNDMAKRCVDRLIRLRRDDWSHQGHRTTCNPYYLSSVYHELVAGLYYELEVDIQHLGLMSLKTHRVRGDLIEAFKFLNGSYIVDADIFFEYDKGNRRGHSKKLFKRRSRLDIRKYVFGNRVTDKWNNLPQCRINCTP